MVSKKKLKGGSSFDMVQGREDSHCGNLNSARESADTNANAAVANRQGGGFVKNLMQPNGMPDGVTGGLVNTANTSQQGSAWSKGDKPQTPDSCMTKGTIFGGRTKRRRTKRRRTKRKRRRKRKKSFRKRKKRKTKRRKRRVLNIPLRFSKMPPLKL